MYLKAGCSFANELFSTNYFGTIICPQMFVICYISCKKHIHAEKKKTKKNRAHNCPSINGKNCQKQANVIQCECNKISGKNKTPRSMISKIANVVSKWIDMSHCFMIWNMKQIQPQEWRTARYVIIFQVFVEVWRIRKQFILKASGPIVRND